MGGEFYQKGKTEKLDIRGIVMRLDNAGYGLSALKSLIDLVKGKLDDAASGLAALKALIDAIKSQADKLAGAAPVSDSTTADWQIAEVDVVSLGGEGIRNKVHDLSLSLHNLAGTAVTVRLYKKINGTERKCYEQSFNAAADPPGAPVINGTWGIHGVLRVTLQSNSAADNGQAVDYDYMLEAM